MPHADRQTRLAYMAKHHAKHRPSPQPIDHSRRALPPYGALRISDDGTGVQCHACGKWYRSLVSHVRMHGMTVAGYKEMYGLARGLSLWSPTTKAAQRDAALQRDQGAVGRQVLASIGPGIRPPGLDMRLSSRIASSQAKRGTYRGRPMERMTGPWLRHQRRALGLTQAGLAAELGFTGVWIGMMERGESPIQRTTALAVEALRYRASAAYVSWSPS